MSVAIRRLGPGDEPILEILAHDEADFELDRDEPAAPLAPSAAADYLADPAILHWIAVEDGVIAGHINGHVLRMRAGDALEVLLYEIGVRAAYRRRGIGRALIGEMTAWMAERGIRTTWVLAGAPGAEAFYRACGFAVPPEMATFLLRELRPR
jgi:GNAT superfamily N-acetyltransferase